VGRWEESREALETVIEMRGEDAPTLAGGPRWWFLTMALAQSGEKEKARSYYDQLAEEMGGTSVSSKQHDRLRADAAKLLGVEDTEELKGKPEGPTHTEAEKEKTLTNTVETY
jgi:hypothetical protein